MKTFHCPVDNLNLSELGFEKIEPSFEERPCYDQKSLLKLYLYGYRKNIRSSRKLAAACVVNIEVMWMMGGLQPDFRTISDFRKENVGNLKAVFKKFLRRVTVDLETGFVSIDGSKFKAWNSKDRNFTITKLDDRIKWLEDHTQEYLRLIEEADKEEGAAEENLTKEGLEAKLKEAESDAASTEAEEIKKCLHAGVVPEVYKEIIDDMEVVEVRRKVADETQNVSSPYGTEEEMKERAGEGYYVRDPERDLVYCPGGETLRKKCIKKGGATGYNISRAENMFTYDELMALVGA